MIFSQMCSASHLLITDELYKRTHRKQAFWQTDTEHNFTFLCFGRILISATSGIIKFTAGSDWKLPSDNSMPGGSRWLSLAPGYYSVFSYIGLNVPVWLNQTWERFTTTHFQVLAKLVWGIDCSFCLSFHFTWHWQYSSISGWHKKGPDVTWSYFKILMWLIALERLVVYTVDCVSRQRLLTAEQWP